MGQLSGPNKCKPNNTAATVANLEDVFELLLAMEGQRVESAIVLDQ